MEITCSLPLNGNNTSPDQPLSRAIGPNTADGARGKPAGSQMTFKHISFAIVIATVVQAATIPTVQAQTVEAQTAEPQTPPTQEVRPMDAGASILMYHRFGEDDYPSTNVTLEQIDQHIAEIKQGGYTPMALSEIVRRLKAGEDFPKKTVGVSIDDAYLSVYTQAWPRFKKAGIPFTVFVATNPVDRSYARYMSWDQIREMAADPLVTIGSQTASHLHMIEADLDANARDLAKSNERFQAELGHVPDLIAYPYGEYDIEATDAVKAAGFIAAFGQHSGAFGKQSDIFGLPRFAMNEDYGDLSRLKTAAGALPIPVADFTPADTVVQPNDNPPAIGFTLAEDLPKADQLACFSNHEGKLSVEHLGPRIEVRMTTQLPQGRTRLNCTMPAGEGRWRWLGRLLYVQ